jgi:type VI secretion system protein VasG
MRSIIELQLGRIGRRIHENYRATFKYTPELVGNIAARCTEVESGARNVDHILTRSMLPELSAEFLSRMASGEPIRAVEVTVDAEGAFKYSLT